MKGPSCDVGWPCGLAKVGALSVCCSLSSPGIPPLFCEVWPGKHSPFPRLPLPSSLSVSSTLAWPQRKLQQRSLNFPTPSSPQFSADRTTDFPSRPIPLQFSTTLHSIWGR